VKWQTRFPATLADISVPVTIRGVTEQTKTSMRTRPFVILLRWQRYEAAVVVDLEPA
jgi:chemotaxis protein CheX